MDNIDIIYIVCIYQNVYSAYIYLMYSISHVYRLYNLYIPARLHMYVM